MVKIRALNDNVIFQVIKPEDTVTKGGLLLPGHLKETDPYGIVIDLSETAQKETKLKVGDKVVLNGHQILQTITVDGEKYIFLSYKSLLGVFDME